MAAQGAMIDVQPLDAFVGVSRETTEAIKSWVMDQLNARMELVGRAADFINSLDAQKKAVEQHCTEEVERVVVIIADLNKTKEDVKGLSDDIKAKMDDNDVKMQVVPDLTQKLDVKTEQIQTLFNETQKYALKSDASLKENEDKVTELHAKTRVFAEKITGDLENTKVGLLAQTTKLRDDIVVWSDGYAGKIEAMVKGGDFKYQRGTSTQKAKFDKKEVSVWQIPAGVSKPDFRHWADSVDLQLEAVHHFVFPDLVLEKVKRLTSEVTEASLAQIIAKINEEHKMKEGAKRLAADGHPPGLPGTDP
jgi:hypothetical protein